LWRKADETLPWPSIISEDGGPPAIKCLPRMPESTKNQVLRTKPFHVNLWLNERVSPKPSQLTAPSLFKVEQGICMQQLRVFLPVSPPFPHYQSTHTPALRSHLFKGFISYESPETIIFIECHQLSISSDFTSADSNNLRLKIFIKNNLY
jgi:hypothetical protein